MGWAGLGLGWGLAGLGLGWFQGMLQGPVSPNGEQIKAIGKLEPGQPRDMMGGAVEQEKWGEREMRKREGDGKRRKGM